MVNCTVHVYIDIYTVFLVFTKHSRMKMSGNKFVKKLHIMIFILLVIILHLVIYVMSEVKFSTKCSSSINKPNTSLQPVSMTVYTRWTEVGLFFLYNLVSTVAIYFIFFKTGT